MGFIVILAPDTQAVFMPVNAAATIFLCLLKSGLAGLAAGFIFKLFAHFGKKTENENKAKALFATGIIVSALIVPIAGYCHFQHPENLGILNSQGQL